jgi:tRNA (cytidine/uridine-2'-O-)-methyltransferase
VVLVEPEIPHNTGNIGRTCVAMNCHLHLVEPLGFSLNEKQVRRAGLDYWKALNLTQHKSYTDWQKAFSQNKCYFFTTKTERSLFDVNFQQGDTLVFGPETRGLAAGILEQNQGNLVTIPMLGSVRSLNLSNAVAIAVYEAYRKAKQSLP